MRWLGEIKVFGSEQGFIQSRFLLRLAYTSLGEFRYPLRFRWILLRRSLPKDFFPKVVWDAGCGEGQTSFWLSKHFPNARIIGTDIKEENVEYCEHITRYLKRSNTTFISKDVIEGVPQVVDLIVCFEVLEHIENYGNALQSFSDSLVPGGYLMIHAPAANSFQSGTWGLRRFVHPEIKTTSLHDQGQYHVRPGFNLEELAGEIENLGFHVLKKNYTFGFIAMFAHTIYEWTRSRSKIWQIVTLWPLLGLSYLDMWISFPIGGGVLIVAQKQ